MKEPITASLEAIQRLGSEAFSSTALAADVGPTLRRVGRRRVARVAVTAVAATVLVGAAAVGALAYGTHVASPAGPSTSPHPSASGVTVDVVVQSGDTGRDIARALEDAGVISSAQDFIDVATARDPESRGIVPGHYALPVGMTATEALDALLEAGPTVTSVTIPEGFTEAQIVERVHARLGIPVADLEAALAAPDSIGLPPEANGNAEGWLGPYTYSFAPDVTAVDVLSAMVNATVSHLMREEVPRDEWLRVLTVASMIEREVKLDVDRPKVARVIYNRLDAGMALELDSTVRYVIGGEASIWQSREDRLVDSPYNTYLYRGLPPGPIASPSEASIDGALHPADGTWMFFVTINLDTGETAYATTLPEHMKNVEKLQAWIKATNAGDE